ncbi:hypothetical protein SteCoe_27589 [Stentor coeruleus]|uniref:Uncharacterized protein n=1 Tax=Stentor coeruleus TaxID=5963 RepID=A0A1R2BA80_9CILI|nr:hypothetical protein SteCoe_27589 [Stentor coeruleus]
MDSNNQSVYSKSKAKKFPKNLYKGKKPSPLILPQIKDPNFNIHSSRHLDLGEEIKFSSDPNRKVRANGLSPISPSSEDHFAPLTPLLDSPKTHKSNKIILIKKPKIKKSPSNYNKHDNLEPISQNSHEKDLIHTNSSSFNLEAKLQKISGSNLSSEIAIINSEPHSIENDEEKSLDQVKENINNWHCDKDIEYIKITTNEGLSDIFLDENQAKEIIKNDAETWKEKHIKLEEVYYNDTNALKKTIERLKLKNRMICEERDKALEKLENISSKHENCGRIIEEKDKCYKKEIAVFETRLSNALETANSKNYELIQTVECANRNNKIKREQDVIISELHEKSKALSDVNTMYINELNSLKSSLESCQKELKAERKKSASTDTLIKDLSAAKSLILSLEETKKSLKSQLEFINTNYKNLQESFNRYQERVLENEKTLKATIEKLKTEYPSSPNPLPIIIPQDLPKLRRFSTITSNNHDQLSQDTIKKLMIKVASLEQQAILNQQEIDKSLRDQAYNRKVIEEKNVIIGRMEKQILNNVIEKQETFRKNIFKEIDMFFENYRKNRQIVTGTYECNMCKIKKVKLVAWPCDNVDCKRGVSLIDNCLECRTPVRINEIEVLKELLGEFKNNFLVFEETKS